MSELIGRTLSKVEIQKLLGRGGMAEVYLGRHTTLNRQVAVKVMQAHLLDDAGLLTRFTSEAQAVAAMRHPNIVQVFDFDVLDDRPYMVMELLEGPSLRDFLATLSANRQTLPIKTVARLIASLAAALDYAHARGIIHRDVKPANIMLRREGGQIDPNAPLPIDAEPVLTDFGVARIADAASHTVSGTIIGTPAYMSPEQIRGEGVDARSDIYSLGIILYEMLIGKVPFSGDTQASILMKHVNEPIPSLPVELSDLQPITDRALAKDPILRFQKASDLATVLQASLGMPSDMNVTEPRLREIMGGPAAGADPDSTVAFHDMAGHTTRQEVPRSDATIASKPAGFNPLWAIAGIGALAIIVGGVVLGPSLFGGTTVEPTAETTETSAEGTQETTGTQAVVVPSGPVGTAVFGDTNVTLTLAGLPNPADGNEYQAWLTDDNAPPLNIGSFAVTDGAASFTFDSPNGQNLLVTFSRVVVTEEPAGSSPAAPGTAVFEGSALPEDIARVRHLFELYGAQPLKLILLNSLKSQNDAYNSHLNFTTTAIVAGDLNGARTHGEHIINIMAGAESDDYADWNGNGRTENPGDDFGLIPYVQLVKSAALGAARDPQAAADAAGIADDVAQAADSVVQTLTASIRLAKQVVNADEIDNTIRLLADDLGGSETNNAVTLLRQEAEKLDLVITVEIVPAQ